MSRKSQRVVLKSQVGEIITNVYDFMEKEASNNNAEKLTDARWRTAQAVGVCESTVIKIVRERQAYHAVKKNAVEPNTIKVTKVTVPSTENAIIEATKVVKVEIESEDEESMSHSNLVITELPTVVKVEFKNEASTLHTNLAPPSNAAIFASHKNKRQKLCRY